MCTYTEQAKDVIILLSHICDLAGIFYEGPKPFHWGMVLKSRYIAQHLFQHPKIPCPSSHLNSKVASHEVIYSQVQLLHILHKITSGLIDIGKELNDARECILDVLGKAGPLSLIGLESLRIEYSDEHYGRITGRYAPQQVQQCVKRLLRHSSRVEMHLRLRW
jgi:hypothetical protein